MSLRIKLLLLSLFTLALPWAGCQYARQMETVLRAGQEASLLTTASTLALVLAADEEFIALDNNAVQYKLADQYAVQLTTQPLLDGFADEWPIVTRALPSDSRPASNDYALRFGWFDGALYAHLRVRDARIVYENPSRKEGDVSLPDRIILVIADGATDDTATSELLARDAWSISAAAPGPIIAHRASVAAPWRMQSQSESDIRGTWRESTDGYDIELRIPPRFAGKFIALASQDDTAPMPNEIQWQRLVSASPLLHQRLDQYAAPGVRISTLDAHGWLLARAGNLAANESNSDDESPINVYRMFLGRTEAEAPPNYGLPYGMWGVPLDAARQGESSAIWFRESNNEPSTVRAAVPIMRGDHIAGVVAVEQDGGPLLAKREAALTKLLDLTMWITLLAMASMLAFALRLSLRIRRLSKAAAHALSADGKVEHRLPETSTRDELGDLARSYATLLQRFKEYTQYLQTLGAKLTHEIRTPLAIVSSSLDNLSAEQSGGPTQQYVDRARDGANRLHAIVTAMSEATRVEQSIEQAERVQFDLAALVRSIAQAYRQSFASHQVTAQVPDSVYTMTGAPELIAQMLDKLMDNAADFCPQGGHIEIQLLNELKYYRLIVSNEGPPLPAELTDKLFDAMVSGRTGDRQRPHLGLGLFIVQLIVRFHRGRVHAANLPEQRGVAFEIELPSS